MNPYVAKCSIFINTAWYYIIANSMLFLFIVKLIRVNDPDLVLFVGEALVGNEAVNQLVKFNRALADHSDVKDPRLIDGILLTKFDTIDDKVPEAQSIVRVKPFNRKVL